MGEETSPLVHWLQITGRYEVVIQAGYVAPSIGSVFFRTHAQFPPNETVNYFADRSLEFRVREMLLVQEGGGFANITASLDGSISSKGRETCPSFIVLTDIYFVAFIFFTSRDLLIIPVKKGDMRVRGYIECP